jgi:hypothetical protein
MPDGMSLSARPDEVATTVPLRAESDDILTFSLQTWRAQCATEVLDFAIQALVALLG